MKFFHPVEDFLLPEEISKMFTRPFLLRFVVPLVPLLILSMLGKMSEAHVSRTATIISDLLIFFVH